jgi:hypothetical protein
MCIVKQRERCLLTYGTIYHLKLWLVGVTKVYFVPNLCQEFKGLEPDKRLNM